MLTNEQMLIGTCLCKPDLLDLAAVKVKPEHFKNKSLGNLYGLMLDLLESGTAPNIQEIVSNSKDGVVFGFTVADLALMMDVIPLGREVERAAVLIKQDSIRRGAEIMSKQLADEAGAMTPEEISIRAGAIAEYAAEHADRADEATAGAAADVFFKRLGSAGGEQSIQTGIKPFDALTGGLYNSEVSVIAGRPSMGKSAMGLSLAKHLSLSGYPGAFFSLEMSTDSLIQRMVSDLSGVFLEKIRRHRLYDPDWPKVTYAVEVIRSWPLHFIYNRGLTPREIHARLRIMKRKHGIRYAIIDHLHLFRGKGPIFEVVTKAMLEVFLMAGDLDIPIIALAQLNRDNKDRANKKPTLSDLRGSGEIEQSSHNIFFVHGDDYHDVSISERPIVAERQLIAAKQRQANTGHIPYRFEGRVQRVEWE